MGDRCYYGLMCALCILFKSKPNLQPYLISIFTDFLFFGPRNVCTISIMSFPDTTSRLEITSTVNSLSLGWYCLCILNLEAKSGLYWISRWTWASQLTKSWSLHWPFSKEFYNLSMCESVEMPNMCTKQAPLTLCS